MDTTICCINVPIRRNHYLDADLFILQNPEMLLEDSGYKKKHALFFHDRTAFPGYSTKSDWCAANFPLPLSDTYKSARIYNKQTEYEQESGVIVVNKKKKKD